MSYFFASGMFPLFLKRTVHTGIDRRLCTNGVWRRGTGGTCCGVPCLSRPSSTPSHRIPASARDVPGRSCLFRGPPPPPLGSKARKNAAILRTKRVQNLIPHEGKDGANMGPAKLAKTEKMGIKIINKEKFLNILVE